MGKTVVAIIFGLIFVTNAWPMNCQEWRSYAEANTVYIQFLAVDKCPIPDGACSGPEYERALRNLREGSIYRIILGVSKDPNSPIKSRRSYFERDGYFVKEIKDSLGNGAYIKPDDARWIFECK